MIVAKEMNHSHYVRLLIGLGTLCCLMGDGRAAFAAPPPDANVLAGQDAGAQLSRMEREQQRRAQQERLDAGAQEGLDTPPVTQTEEEGTLHFVLHGVTFDRSAIFTAEELDAFAADLLEKDVTVSDLYDLVAKINAAYESRGRLTCRAVLAPQTIRGGIVHITLIEGRTGEVTVEGNRHTAQSFLEYRLGIERGEIPNFNELNRNLLRWNASYDAPLRVRMAAGKEEGTTDYVLEIAEPRNETIALYADNMGSISTGRERVGLIYTNRSLSKSRDRLTLMTLDARGMRSFLGNYQVPLGRDGSTLRVGYSANATHIVKGTLEPLRVRGHSMGVNLGWSIPLYVTRTRKTELYAGYGYTHAQTDFSGNHWIDDTTNGYNISVTQTLYGRKSALLFTNGIRAGATENIGRQESRFSMYQGNVFYQTRTQGNQLLTARLDAQIGFANYLPSAERFYIGGAQSVRGYEESLLGGDSGYAASIEYAFPMLPKSCAYGFLFYDCGAVYGDSAFDDHILSSWGLGIRTAASEPVYAQLTVGFPLRKELNDTKNKGVRLHFSLNATL